MSSRARLKARRFREMRGMEHVKNSALMHFIKGFADIKAQDGHRLFPFLCQLGQALERVYCFASLARSSAPELAFRDLVVEDGCCLCCQPLAIEFFEADSLGKLCGVG